jgi:CheY-like chemotaxis protein
MTISSKNQTSIADSSNAVADVLLVRVPPAAIAALHPDSFSRVETAGQALDMLKLLRFQLLVASLDVPDMQPWELFFRARRAQGRLQCVLLDGRMTLEDEQRVRQAGASAFASNDPAICEALVRSSPRITRRDTPIGDSGKRLIPRSPDRPTRAPP